MALSAFSQQNLPEFNKQYYQCENKWVVLPKNDNGEYIVGFIYLDREAGFTLQYGGFFTVSDSGVFEYAPSKRDSSMKYRIPKNYVKVAVLPDNKVKEMELAQVPDWLAIYREGENEISQLVRRGFIFNAIGASSMAILYCLKPIK